VCILLAYTCNIYIIMHGVEYVKKKYLYVIWMGVDLIKYCFNALRKYLTCNVSSRDISINYELFYK
jgi:hypothetical protein